VNRKTRDIDNQHTHMFLMSWRTVGLL